MKKGEQHKLKVLLPFNSIDGLTDHHDIRNER